MMIKWTRTRTKAKPQQQLPQLLHEGRPPGAAAEGRKTKRNHRRLKQNQQYQLNQQPLQRGKRGKRGKRATIQLPSQSRRSSRRRRSRRRITAVLYSIIISTRAYACDRWSSRCHKKCKRDQIGRQRSGGKHVARVHCARSEHLDAKAKKVDDQAATALTED